MRWIKAIMALFSTYTRIPMPQVKWDDNAMKLAIAFLPLVGAVVGGAVWLWQIFCLSFEISAMLFAAVTTTLPIVITGGIHLDGYCDTSDALASWQDKERGLEILKDPHVGAYAVIRLGVYLLITFALLYELFERGIDAGIGFTYVLSRCLAVWSTMTMPNARKDGMLVAFTRKADRLAVGVTLVLLTTIGAAGWIFFTFPHGLIGLVFCLPVTFWYRGTARKRFGGVTGDTTGFYLQTIELTLFVGLLTGGLVLAWLNPG